MKLVFGLVALWVEQLGCLLPGVEVPPVLGQRLVLYRSRSRDLRSQYIRSFSIIGALWFSR